VPHAIIEAPGAVSEQCARAMAEGARRITGADIAVSVTGVAGPESDERGNPVGLVYIAATNGKDFISSANRFFGDRHDIRLASVNAMFRDAIRLIGGF
jgi:nicotinamide-nucleotide amidase